MPNRPPGLTKKSVKYQILTLCVALAVILTGCQGKRLNLSDYYDEDTLKAEPEPGEGETAPPADTTPWQGIILPLDEIGPKNSEIPTGRYLYVDIESGSDREGNGRAGAPYKTIEHAVSTANKFEEEEVVIIVAEGEYEDVAPIRLTGGKRIVCGFESGAWERDPQKYISVIKSNIIGEEAESDGEALPSGVDGCLILSPEEGPEEGGNYSLATRPISPAILVNGPMEITNNTIIPSGSPSITIKSLSDTPKTVLIQNNLITQPEEVAGQSGIIVKEGADSSLNVTIERNFIQNSLKGITCTDCGSSVKIIRNIIEIASGGTGIEGRPTFNGGAAVTISTSYNQPSNIAIERNILWLDQGATLIDQHAFAESTGNIQHLGDASSGSPSSLRLNTIYAPDASSHKWLYRGYTNDLSPDINIYPTRLNYYIENGSPLWNLNKNAEANIPDAGIQDNVLLPPPEAE